jgi:putative transposase
LAIELDLNLLSEWVIRVLDRIALAEYAEEHRIHLDFIEPGKPIQNSFIERLNRTYRIEVLDMYAFRDLDEVREISRNWIREHNEEQSHQSLRKLTPMEYRMKYCPENYNLGWH